jgi:hypothetical protein
VTTEGWIFMVGFRIFDVGLLIVWLVWFFRLRDDDDQSDDDGPGGGGSDSGPGKGPGGGGLGKRIGGLDQGRWRSRDHRAPRQRVPRRGRETLPAPSPSRVRLPRTPQPTHRRGAYL